VTGNSVITLADRMDAGLVLAQSERAIAPEMTAGELHDLLARDGAPLVMRVLADHGAGAIRGVEQDESAVTVAPKLSREDARLDLAASAEACRARINGLSPWPGVRVRLAGEELKLVRAASEAGDGSGPPGTVIDPERGIVACGRGALRLVEVQPAGKRAMAWRDFARGRAVARGAVVQPAGEGSA
jgi:methionyl-tRNA formyltransferase